MTDPASGGGPSAIGFGTGTSDDHRDGIRWVDYTNISWNPVFCKRCDICVEICPKDTLVLRNDAIIEEENCILCGLCERYCPDLAIEMIPEAVAAHAAKERVSGRFIGYPTGWTLAIFDDPDAAEAASAELAASGIGPDDLILLAGPDAADRMSRLGASSGIGARCGARCSS